MRGRNVPSRKSLFFARRQMTIRPATESEHRVAEIAMKASESEALPMWLSDSDQVHWLYCYAI